MTEEVKNKQMKDPEAEAKQAERDVKKKIDAFYEVQKHKLGRPPSMEEIVSAMQEGAINPSEHPESEKVLMPNEKQELLTEQEEDLGPAILRMKVYHGMKDAGEGSREPDPSNILFYETPDSLVFDTEKNSWLGERPAILDHLPCRDMNNDETDVISAIIHGVMSDDDFEALDKVGMMSDNPKKLWNLTKKLNGQIEDMEMSLQSKDQPTEDLEKSEEPEESDIEYETDLEPTEAKEEPIDLEPSGEATELPGSDLISELVQTAMKEALADPNLEKTIRSIVRDEMGRGSEKEPIDSQHLEESEI